MKTVLFFHTSLRQAWQKELAGAYRFARMRNWRIQVIEPTKRPPSIPKLIDFWHPLGCVAECSNAPSDYFDPSAAMKLRANLAADTLAKAHYASNPASKLVWLWESYMYRNDAAVKAEIDAFTPQYIARIAAWNGAIESDLRLELSNMGGFVKMAVRNGLFGTDDPLYQAVMSALKRTRSIVKHY